MVKRLIAIFLVALFIAGCTTNRPVVTKAYPKLSLSSTQTASTDGIVPIKITLPAGEYRAVYADSDGVFYAPEGRIIVHGRPDPDAYVLVEDGRAMGYWSEGSKVIVRFTPAVDLK